MFGQRKEKLIYLLLFVPPAQYHLYDVMSRTSITIIIG